MEQGRAAGRETHSHQKQVYIKSNLTFKISPTFLGAPAIAPIAPPVNPPLAFSLAAPRSYAQ